MRRARHVIAAALLVAAAAGHATAQPDKPAPGEEETPAKRQARALLREGVRLSQLHKPAQALELFRAAYAAYPSPLILINIGLSLRELDRLPAAADTFQQFLDAPDRDADRVATVEADLAALDKQLGRLRFTIDTPGGAAAEVQIDNGPWRPARLIRVMPGKHHVRARTAGVTRVAEADVEATAGALSTVTLGLLPGPTAPARPPTPSGPPDGPPAKPAEITARPTPPPDEVRRPAPPPDLPDTDLSTSAPAVPSRPGRLGARAQVLVEATGKGAAGSLAATFAVHPRVELAAGGIVGPNAGGFASATIALTGGRLRPTLTGGVPFMVKDGVHVGVRGAAGLAWSLSRRVGLIADLNVEYYFSPGEFDLPLAVVPSLGVHARL